MKRFLILFLAFVLIVCDASAITKYVTTDLNLRSGPSTCYSVITILPKGTPVEIEEDCTCAWVPVRYNGYVGYVNSKYISYTKPCLPSTQTYSQKSITHTTTSSASVPKYYTNVDGYRVQSPTRYESKPAGATALCRDGSYSFSMNHRGTCSHHGGVVKWYK
jgi:uncharacterized protein YraI